MRGNSPFTFHRIVFLVVLVFAGHGFAQFKENVIHNFLNNSDDGDGPEGSLVADAAGNLYGNTFRGGTCCGTVFELSPPATAGRSWTETIIYGFQGGNDGGTPVGTLIFDKQGNLYGTTTSASTIFELSPPLTPGGEWTKTTLWLFTGSTVPGPTGKLAMDDAGNLYGTTLKGGRHGWGRVLELVRPKTAGAAWGKKIIYEFGSVAGDGIYPEPDLLLRNGSLYGTTAGGGAVGESTIFRLTNLSGVWTETILHSLAKDEGFFPVGELIMDSAGNLFGTAEGGGNVACAGGFGCGSVFELSPPTIDGDPWLESTLYRFRGTDGAQPLAALWHNKEGTLYGTTYMGGLNGRNRGVIFKLKPPTVAGGDWTETTLHYFKGGGLVNDGTNPTSGLILVNGKFYGTTSNGGSASAGIFFSLEQ